MREDDEFRHFVPLLRRIIILVAVIIAVPVILWTITAFVRTYVGPPHIPTFHQLASTASINAPPANASPEATAQLQTAMQQAGMTNSASSSVADARASDAAATKGSLLSDRGTEGDATAQGTPRAEVFRADGRDLEAALAEVPEAEGVAGLEVHRVGPRLGEGDGERRGAGPLDPAREAGRSGGLLVRSFAPGHRSPIGSPTLAVRTDPVRRRGPAGALSLLSLRP